MKQQIRDFFPFWKEDETFAVTLTMKQYTQGQRLDEIIASRNLTHFLNRLNRICLGNAHRRYNRKIEVIPVLEESYSGRLHYHLTLRNPHPENAFRFEQRIKYCWAKTRFADAQIDIQRATDVARWNRYITKDWVPDIDWTNYHTLDETVAQ